MSNKIIKLLQVINNIIILPTEHTAQNVRKVCRLATTYTTYSDFRFYLRSMFTYMSLFLVKYSFVHFSFVHFPFVAKARPFFLTRL